MFEVNAQKALEGCTATVGSEASEGEGGRGRDGAGSQLPSADFYSI